MRYRAGYAAGGMRRFGRRSGMGRGDHRVDAAADPEITHHGHAARPDRGHQVVEDAVGDVLVEVSLVAERPEVELQRLQLDAQARRDVLDADGREVRLPGPRAQAGELRA